MPYIPANFLVPLVRNYVIQAKSDPVNVKVPMLYDTVSWVCGNLDGMSFCGTNGPEGIIFSFKDAQGLSISMPSDIFDFVGNELILHAPDNSLLG